VLKVESVQERLLNVESCAEIKKKCAKCWESMREFVKYEERMNNVEKFW